jgi:REP element-mobilizing transposase RayT
MSENKYKNKYRVPSARWATWDYASEGAYFVTICTKHKEHYFGEIVNDEMQYSELGLIAVREWIKSAELRPDMELDMACFQVMPDHIHGIVVIGRNCRDAMHGVSIDKCDEFGDAKHGVENRDAKHGVCTGAGYGPQSKNLASIMRGFKSAVTMQARMLNIPFDWQARYHDRVIRDDEEFRRIAAYIEQNPLNWCNDDSNTKNKK